MKVNLIFPGQGSQYVGMGARECESSTYKEVYSEASEALGFDLSALCLNGPDSELMLTQNTQPAIVAYSILLFREVKNFLANTDVKINCVLGHSVGEYSALVACESISFYDAVKSVHMRGKYMQEAVPVGLGKMYAVLKVPSEMVERACREVSDEHNQCMVANFNDPTQNVISGHSKACDMAIDWLKENYEGRQMAIPLKVSAPFHSSLMKPAQVKLESFFEEVNFHSNHYQYIANIDAQLYPVNTAAETIKSNLVKQVSGSILWNQSLESFEENAIFLEVGAGKVLTGLNRKINKSFQTLQLDQPDWKDKLQELLSL